MRNSIPNQSRNVSWRDQLELVTDVTLISGGLANAIGFGFIAAWGSWGLEAGWCLLLAVLGLGTALLASSRLSLQSRDKTAICLVLFGATTLLVALVHPQSFRSIAIVWFVASLLMFGLERLCGIRSVELADLSDAEPKSVAGLHKRMVKRMLVRLVAAPVMLIFAGCIVLGVGSLLQQVCPQVVGLSWKQTHGELTQCEPVAKHKWNTQLKVAYQYEVDGQPFAGVRDRGLLSRHGHEFNSCANERIRELRNSGSLNVYYNPREPSESMLLPGFHWDNWMEFSKLAIHASIFLTCWWLLLVSKSLNGFRFSDQIPTPIMAFGLVAIGASLSSTIYFLLPGVTPKHFFAFHVLVISIAYAGVKRTCAKTDRLTGVAN